MTAGAIASLLLALPAPTPTPASASSGAGPGLAVALLIAAGLAGSLVAVWARSGTGRRRDGR